MNENQLFAESYLAHHGVKGMKWGVRRASKYVSKAQNLRDKADKWDSRIEREMSKKQTKKRVRRISEYGEYASQYKSGADKYQNKANKMVEKRYAKSGKKLGRADYEREKGDEAYNTHDKNAKSLEKLAKKYDSSGQYLKAEAARRSASAVRTRGENVKAKQYELADYYLKSGEHLKEKASSFATTAKIDIGSKKVNEILNKSRLKGYEVSKLNDQARQEMELENMLGSTGYSVYKNLKGK